MRRYALMIVTLAIVAGLVPAAALALVPYSQNFEGMVQASPTALSDNGWLVYGNVSSPTNVYLYGYGPFPAPNGSGAFCAIDAGQGGDPQGLQQLAVYSDYNNTDHGAGNLIESNVYREQTVTAGDVGKTWVFAFDAKRGNLAGASEAKAFIKTLNPAAGWALTNFVSANMTTIPETWSNYSISLTIDASLVGQIFQIGFLNTATFYEPSAIFYDNVDLHEDTNSGVPVAALPGAELRQNYPNPFNPSTRIDFALEKAGNVELSVFDLAGRHVATLRNGTLAAGDHHVVWNGRSDTGASLPAGQYRYVLATVEGRVARSMVLVK
ncbi:MAG: hypothetical protein IPK64_15055 [bacterium]|nr:hypothetical protein [bacterium]